MVRASVVLVIVVVWAGCSKPPSTASEDPRPIDEGRSSMEPESSTAVDSEPVRQADMDATPDGDTTEERVEAEIPLEEAGTDDEYDDAPAVARDLATELNAAIGSLRDCMQDIAIVRSSIEVSATALVLPAGTVAQPSVTGTGLSQRERSCIAGRVRAVVLEPLEDQTSKRVTTSILIDLSAPAPAVRVYQVGAPDPVLRNVRDPLPKRPEVAPSGRPIQEPTSRPIQEPTSRPIQEPQSRKVRGPKPRPIDGWEVDESSKDWR